MIFTAFLLLISTLFQGLLAAPAAGTCNVPALSSSAGAPVVASGYSARLIANGLQSPRFTKFDNKYNLLVVESGKGVTALKFTDYGGSCLSLASKKTVISDSTLNHGLAFSLDYRYLYASSSTEVKRWNYDSNTASVSGSPTVLINNMGGSDHVTRTLITSFYAPGQLVVTRGSTENIDPQARNLSSGVSQIKSFDVTGKIPFPQDYSTSGRRLGWGLRNDVGIDEQPYDGGLWAVENSADQVTRDGVDIHLTNPAEKLNYLGTLVNNKSPNQGANFGYPDCFAAWNPSILPQNSGISVGSQFAIDGSTVSDAQCKTRIAPRLSMTAHTAPLTLKFHPSANSAWVSFHGSWDTSPPAGYYIGSINYAKGQPTDASTSTTAVQKLVWNADNTQCPGKCFRPVGISWDSNGNRFYFSSDATGEIYVVSKS